MLAPLSPRSPADGKAESVRGALRDIIQRYERSIGGWYVYLRRDAAPPSCKDTASEQRCRQQSMSKRVRTKGMLSGGNFRSNWLFGSRSPTSNANRLQARTESIPSPPHTQSHSSRSRSAGRTIVRLSCMAVACYTVVFIAPLVSSPLLLAKVDNVNLEKLSYVSTRKWDRQGMDVPSENLATPKQNVYHDYILATDAAEGTCVKLAHTFETI